MFVSPNSGSLREESVRDTNNVISVEVGVCPETRILKITYNEKYFFLPFTFFSCFFMSKVWIMSTLFLFFSTPHGFRHSGFGKRSQSMTWTRPVPFDLVWYNCDLCAAVVPDKIHYFTLIPKKNYYQILRSPLFLRGYCTFKRKVKVFTQFDRPTKVFVLYFRTPEDVHYLRLMFNF